MEGTAGFGAGTEVVYDGGSGVDELSIALGVDSLGDGQSWGDHMEELSECFIWIGDGLVVWIDLEMVSKRE
jgi:hypothetical protein